MTQTGYLGNPEGLRFDESGNLFIAGRTDQSSGIYQVNPPSGEQSVVSEDPQLVRPFYLEFVDQGDLLIGDLGPLNAPEVRIFRLDRDTGDVSLFLDGDSGSLEPETTLTGMIDLVRVPTTAGCSIPNSTGCRFGRL